MVMDATGPSFGANLHEDEQEEQPNASTQGLYEMLAATQALLWEGCLTHLELYNDDKQQCVLCHASRYVHRASRKGYKDVARKQMWFLHTLKRKVTNKARVEGSICEAYIVEEMFTFCSHYFGTDVQSRQTQAPQNDDGAKVQSNADTFSIFNQSRRPADKHRERMLTDQELHRSTLYVLLNFDEVQPYLNTYVENIRALAPHMDAKEVDKRIESVVIRTKVRSTVDAPTSEQTVHVYLEDEDVLLQPPVVEDEQLDNLRDNVETKEVEEYSINDTFVVEDGEPDNEEEDEDADTIEEEDEDEDIDEEDEEDINEEDDEEDIYEEHDEEDTHE
ncbi:chromatin-remodeling ATPase INO80-like [Diospyros lotus]|uniref:chromatin-remodeling ATPase INO80-like n=1 Tax=Diospyros lotus TaxID=55363 RepID=UPI0022512EAB|nr:chromatin-remodeling ATPase INO80-like [Diospyros lotus]